MLAAAVFSLAIYLWAVRVALPAERIVPMIGRSAGEEPRALPEAA